jgi:hypothetical protein
MSGMAPSRSPRRALSRAKCTLTIANSAGWLAAAAVGPAQPGGGVGGCAYASVAATASPAPAFHSHAVVVGNCGKNSAAKAVDMTAVTEALTSERAHRGATSIQRESVTPRLVQGQSVMAQPRYSGG